MALLPRLPRSWNNCAPCLASPRQHHFSSNSSTWMTKHKYVDIQNHLGASTGSFLLSVFVDELSILVSVI